MTSKDPTYLFEVVGGLIDPGESQNILGSNSVHSFLKAIYGF